MSLFVKLCLVAIAGAVVFIVTFRPSEGQACARELGRLTFLAAMIALLMKL